MDGVGTTRKTLAKTTGKKRSTSPPKIRVLFSCVGRRVELIRAFRRAAESLGVRLEVHGADSSRLAPAGHHVDKCHTIPPISKRHTSHLLTIVTRAKIDLLVPLIDSELQLVADAAETFRSVGCTALISSPQVVRVCRDKLATFKMLTTAKIDTPQTWSLEETLARKRHRFPYFLKPRAGSAAMGNFKINHLDELQVFGRQVPDAIVQEFVAGVEHTLDVYTGLDGKPRCAVPRRRIEVRSGEVSKALIVKDPKIMEIGMRVATALGDCRGVITVQCIVTPRGRIRVIEINPRFGGGVPLAIHAGADFPKWILSDLLGKTPRINPTGFRDDVAMLRFDDSVFLPRASRLMDRKPATR